MPAFDQYFNPSEHENNSFDLLPNGTYQAMITESELCYTKSGNGQYMKFTFEIIGKGKKIFENFNIVNPNEKAVSIAKAQLAQIVLATVGDRIVRVSEELHNIPMSVKVGTEEGKNGYGDRNKIYKYMKYDAAAAAGAELAKEIYSKEDIPF